MSTDGTDGRDPRRTSRSGLFPRDPQAPRRERSGDTGTGRDRRRSSGRSEDRRVFEVDRSGTARSAPPRDR